MTKKLLNLNSLFISLKENVSDYGYTSCGWGSTIDNMTEELIENGYNQKMIKLLKKFVYYNYDIKTFKTFHKNIKKSVFNNAITK